MVEGDDKDKSASDLLYEHALAQEMESLAARHPQAQQPQQPVWQPPSEDQFNDWLAPDRALDILESVNLQPLTRRRWIMSRLKSGFIQAVARTSEIAGSHFQFEPIPQDFWNERDDFGNNHFWNTGDEEFSAGKYMYRFFDVRFDPDTFNGKPPKSKPIVPSLPQPACPEAPELAAPNKGGRPAKPFWEDLLIEIARQLYCGDLQPERQADIEKAMHDWLVANGHPAGETQVRVRAKKLWETTKK